MTVLNNAYFKFTDPRIDAINGEPLHPTWWSRFYEYAFALDFAEAKDLVADMGCGWMGRPLTAELARRCREVYAIDNDIRVKDLVTREPNLYYLPMNFASDEMNHFQTSSFHKIYCISVIEDLSPDDRLKALINFRRLVKPDGNIIITMDAKWESFRYSKPYPTVNLQHFINDIARAGLQFVGKSNLDMPTNAVHQPEWNLACFHCVLERV